MTATRLTTSQTAVLGELLTAFLGTGASINPIAIYPARTNADAARRRIVHTLYTLGRLAHDDRYPASAQVYRLPSVTAAQAQQERERTARETAPLFRSNAALSIWK